MQKYKWGESEFKRIETYLGEVTYRTKRLIE